MRDFVCDFGPVYTYIYIPRQRLNPFWRLRTRFGKAGNPFWKAGNPFWKGWEPVLERLGTRFGRLGTRFGRSGFSRDYYRLIRITKDWEDY